MLSMLLGLHQRFILSFLLLELLLVPSWVNVNAVTSNANITTPVTTSSSWANNFTLGQCIVSLIHYDNNQDGKISRNEFQDIVDSICVRSIGANMTLEDVSSNNTMLVWDAVFTNASCFCRLYDDTNNTDDTNSESDCCYNENDGRKPKPPRKDINQIYHNSPLISGTNYTLSICQYLYESFVEYQCIIDISDKNTDANKTNVVAPIPLPSTTPIFAPNAVLVTSSPTNSPTPLQDLPIPILRTFYDSESKTETNSAMTNSSKMAMAFVSIAVLLVSVMGTTVILRRRRRSQRQGNENFKQEHQPPLNVLDDTDLDDIDSFDQRHSTSMANNNKNKGKSNVPSDDPTTSYIKWLSILSILNCMKDRNAVQDNDSSNKKYCEKMDEENNICNQSENNEATATYLHVQQDEAIKLSAITSARNSNVITSNSLSVSPVICPVEKTNLDAGTVLLLPVDEFATTTTDDNYFVAPSSSDDEFPKPLSCALQFSTSKLNEEQQHHNYVDPKSYPEHEKLCNDNSVHDVKILETKSEHNSTLTLNDDNHDLYLQQLDDRTENSSSDDLMFAGENVILADTDTSDYYKVAITSPADLDKEVRTTAATNSSCIGSKYNIDDITESEKTPNKHNNHNPYHVTHIPNIIDKNNDRNIMLTGRSDDCISNSSNSSVSSSSNHDHHDE